MFLDMEQSSKNISKDDISELESKTNLNLPDEFKSFLLKYNGGSPVECGIDFETDKNGRNYMEVGYFYGINRKPDILVYYNEILAHRIPKGVLSIASTNSNGFILLSTLEKTYGNVYFKDHEVEDSFEFNDSNDTLPGSMTLLANSFSDFLEKLYDPDDE